MRRPLLTNKALRGLSIITTNPAIVEQFLGLHDQNLPSQGLASSEEVDDANRAREWIAATAEWWRETHEGRKP